MPATQPQEQQRSRQAGGLLILAVVSVVAGGAAGLVGAGFRLALLRADAWRGQGIDWAQSRGAVGLMIVVASAAGATALAAWLVRRFAREASGSGIPHVEAVIHGQLRASMLVLVPVKFIGGFLAIGAGLALGREGPTVQMGATISHAVGRMLRRGTEDCRALLAAGAGAGLATAFNAPVAGAVFVLEELVRRFDTRITIATFGASAGAITVARLLLGDAPDFDVGAIGYTSAGMIPAFLLVGVLAGLAGVVYNRAILLSLDAMQRLERWPTELRAAAIGAGVGIVGWFAPALVGGGDPITLRMLTTSPTMLTLTLVFLLRFALGAISYSAGTPGGLFAPLLVLGAQVGLFIAIPFAALFPSTLPDHTPLAIVGMSAFFTAVVRSPVTGIVLVTEMTANSTLLLPILIASFVAMLVPTLLHDPPIYDSLRQRTVRGDQEVNR